MPQIVHYVYSSEDLQKKITERGREKGKTKKGKNDNNEKQQQQQATGKKKSGKHITKVVKS